MIQLLAYDTDNNKWTNLDLQEEVIIAVNKSIEEIQDITQRKTSFTKTFNIPSTDNNERFFRSAFNVNATDFNNKLQTQCIIQDNGNDVFGGRMRLNKITVNPFGTQYEVYIVQEISPFSSELKNFNICELDFSDAQHVVNYDNIVSTWNFSGGSYNNYSGITGNVLYPMAHTGYDENLSYGTYGVGGNNFTNTAYPLTIDQFKPWLNLKYMVDKVFDKAGFTYNSEFLDSDYFKSIFSLAGNNSGMGAAVLGDRPENQNFFDVEFQGANYFYSIGQNQNPADFEHVVFNTINYDYLSQYTKSNFPSQGTGVNYFTAPISGAYKFQIQQEMFLYGTVYAPTYIDVAIVDIDTGFRKAWQDGVVIPPGGARLYTFYLNATSIQKGQRLAFMFRRQTGGGDPYNTIGFRAQNSKFEMYESPNVVPSLGDIKWDDNLPCNISGLDFIQDVLGIFNLTVLPSGQDNFIIEPWVDYLSKQSGTTYDWSTKLDINSTYEIRPLDFDLQRQIHLTYTAGKDILNEYFTNQFNETFGEKYFTNESELLTGNQTIDFKFEPLPTDAIASGATFVMPSLYKFGEPNTDPREIPLSCGLRLGFYCGMNHFYTDDTTTTPTPYYILNGTTSEEHETYPLINHLSLLQEATGQLQIIYPFSDLNFDPTYDFFMQDTLYRGTTDKALYNTFYKPYLELLYSEEARFFKGKFILTPEEISKIDFNDSVYFLNSRWRLYSMNDADITEKSVVECEFLKEPYRTTKVSLVGPNYFIQGLQRTPPGPTPTETLYWYVDNDLGSLSGNVSSLLFEIYQGTTQYLSQTTAGNGQIQIPTGNNFYNFTIDFNFSSGSMNNLRLCIGTSPGGCNIAQLDIPQPSVTSYNIQATEYFPASGNIYATISTY